MSEDELRELELWYVHQDHYDEDRERIHDDIHKLIAEVRRLQPFERDVNMLMDMDEWPSDHHMKQLREYQPPSLGQDLP